MKDTVNDQNNKYEGAQHTDETNFQEELIKELISVTNTQYNDIGNADAEEVEDGTNVQHIRRIFNLRPSRKRDYSNMQLLQDAVIVMNGRGAKERVFKHLTGIIIAQISAKAGIKKHSKLARDALFNKFF